MRRVILVLLAGLFVVSATAWQPPAVAEAQTCESCRFKLFLEPFCFLAKGGEEGSTNCNDTGPNCFDGAPNQCTGIGPQPPSGGGGGGGETCDYDSGICPISCMSCSPAY